MISCSMSLISCNSGLSSCRIPTKATVLHVYRVSTKTQLQCSTAGWSMDANHRPSCCDRGSAGVPLLTPSSFCETLLPLLSFRVPQFLPILSTAGNVGTSFLGWIEAHISKAYPIVLVHRRKMCYYKRIG